MQNIEGPAVSNKKVFAKYGAPKKHSQPGLKTKQSFLLHWNNVAIKKKKKLR